MPGPALSPSVAEYQRVPQGRSDCHCRLAQGSLGPHRHSHGVRDHPGRTATASSIGRADNRWTELNPVVIKSSVSLREDQHAFAKALVEAGRFSSVSAVLQQRANGSFITADQLRARLAAQPR